MIFYIVIIKESRKVLLRYLAALHISSANEPNKIILAKLHKKIQ